MSKDVLLRRDCIYSGRIIDLVVDRIQISGGRQALREVVHHPGGAVALALTNEGRILFVQQPRYPLDRSILELPAGKLDKGEDPAVSVQRELEEETGYVAGQIQHLTSFHTSPGFCDELLHLFLAQDLRPGRQELEHDEDINVEALTLDEALEMVREGQIHDAKSIIGVLWAGLWLRRALQEGP